MPYVVKTTYTKELVKKGLEVYVFQQKNSRRILIVEGALLFLVGVGLIILVGFRVQFLLVALLGVGGLLLSHFSTSIMPPIRDEKSDHTYIFGENALTVEDARGKKDYPYKKFNRLYETQEAIFLFAGGSSFLPLWKSDVEEGRLDGLKEFLETKTNRKFKLATV